MGGQDGAVLTAVVVSGGGHSPIASQPVADIVTA